MTFKRLGIEKEGAWRTSTRCNAEGIPNLNKQTTEELRRELVRSDRVSPLFSGPNKVVHSPTNLARCVNGNRMEVFIIDRGGI